MPEFTIDTKDFTSVQDTLRKIWDLWFNIQGGSQMIGVPKFIGSRNEIAIVREDEIILQNVGIEEYIFIKDALHGRINLTEAVSRNYEQSLRSPTAQYDRNYSQKIGEGKNSNAPQEVIAPTDIETGFKYVTTSDALSKVANWLTVLKQRSSQYGIETAFDLSNRRVNGIIQGLRHKVKHISGTLPIAAHTHPSGGGTAIPSAQDFKALDSQIPNHGIHIILSVDYLQQNTVHGIILRRIDEMPHEKEQLQRQAETSIQRHVKKELRRMRSRVAKGRLNQKLSQSDAETYLSDLPTPDNFDRVSARRIVTDNISSFDMSGKKIHVSAFTININRYPEYNPETGLVDGAQYEYTDLIDLDPIKYQ